MSTQSRHRELVATTPPSRLVLLGHPVSHSLSPLFQNAALLACDFSQRYVALDVAPHLLESTLASLSAENAGGNVTVPYKQQVARLSSVRSPIAERVDAVNTFWFEHGALVGHNTDVAGIVASVRWLFPAGIAGAHCALLGAGGAAAAVAVALDDLGATQLSVHSRTPSRIGSLAGRVRMPITTCATAEAAVRSAQLVVNATPVGMQGDDVPVAASGLPLDARVLDLVYRVGETAFVHAARARGLVAIDGQRMLMEQGAAAFSSWFGVDAPRDVMWAALSGAE